MGYTDFKEKFNAINSIIVPSKVTSHPFLEEFEIQMLAGKSLKNLSVTVHKQARL